MQPPTAVHREEAELPYLPAPPLADEDARRRALANYHILETEAEQSYDDLTTLAAAICGTPIALISLIDDQRQWFKSRVGLEAQSTPRTWSFCAHALHSPQQVMEVLDAREDPRFANNPLVQGPVQLRYYAGAPLVTPEGVPIGALCVIDCAPRQLTPQQLTALQCLARQTIAQLELRVALRQLKQQAENDALLHAETRRAFAAVERKNQELAESRAEALRASQAKSDFLSSMSHEIRTPMNGVLGMNQLLAATSLSPEQRRYVEVVQSSGRQLLALIDDLLDLSKIEAGKVTIECADFDLRHTLNEVSDMWSVQASAKGLAFRANIAAEVPLLLLGDSSRLRQVLNNLANNAIKFTARGAVNLSVELAGKQEDRVLIRFSVADTGIGIRPDQASRLFSPFVQADVSTTRNYGGTGLGLAICKHLVELMGGTIGIESQVGQGSVFWFTSSFAVSQRSALPIEDWTAPEAENRQSLRILVAEDNQINRLVISTQLSKLGHRAEVVVDGFEALKKATAGDYDLLLMDCEMPGMDGYEATRRIRQARRDRLPIIAVTAHAMSGDRERCLAAGMDDFISKPIDMQHLARVLARWGSRKNPDIARE
jgi:signal transduction histidine kinase/CheY-like chemotaxis protein